MASERFVLVETPEYIARLAEIAYPRLGEALRGVRWALAAITH